MTRDFTEAYTRHGAQRLADMVRDYWHSRGHRNVETWIHELEGFGGLRFYGVASNLAGGMPRGTPEAKRAIALLYPQAAS